MLSDTLEPDSQEAQLLAFPGATIWVSRASGSDVLAQLS